MIDKLIYDLLLVRINLDSSISSALNEILKVKIDQHIWNIPLIIRYRIKSITNSEPYPPKL